MHWSANLVLFACASLAAAQPSFQFLPPLNPGDAVYVRGMSGDGQTVVGQVVGSGGVRGVYWRDGQVFEVAPPGGTPFVAAITGASFDGSAFGGIASRFGGSAATVIDAQGSHLVSMVPGHPLYSQAHDISGDGSVAVGWQGTIPDVIAIRIVNRIAHELPGFVGGQGISNAWGVSPNGLWVAGQSRPAGQTDRPVIWDQHGVLTAIPLPRPDDRNGTAHEVSNDGAVVCGYARNQLHAVGWRSVNGVTSMIGSLEPGGESVADAMSADGSVVTGWGKVAGVRLPFIWTEAEGTRPLLPILQALSGETFSGWTQFYTSGMSDDGETLAGHATNPDGEQVGWTVTIPAPGSAVLGLVLFGIAGTSRKRRQT